MNTRLIGLVLIVVSAAAFLLLSRLVVIPAEEQSLLLQMALAAACVLAQVVGTSMLVLGRTLLAPATAPVRIRHFVAGDLFEF